MKLLPLEAVITECWYLAQNTPTGWLEAGWKYEIQDALSVL